MAVASQIVTGEGVQDAPAEEDGADHKEDDVKHCTYS
jgi:hypothetical protein